MVETLRIVKANPGITITNLRLKMEEKGYNKNQANFARAKLLSNGYIKKLNWHLYEYAISNFGLMILQDYEDREGGEPGNLFKGEG